LTENTMCVSSRFQGKGTIHVFELEGDGQWVEKHRLVQPPPRDVAGILALAGSSRTVAFSDYVGNTTPMLHIWEKGDTGEWAEVASWWLKTAYAPTLSMSDDVLILGMRQSSVGDFYDMCEVYERRNGTWQKVFTAYDGKVTAISGETIAVGDPDHNGIWLYNGDSEGDWRYSDSCGMPDRQAGDVFGSTVALSGDWMAGGRTDRPNFEPSRSPAVYLFKRSGKEWTYKTQIEGVALPAFCGEKLVVAPVLPGAARRPVFQIYELDDQEDWVLRTELIPRHWEPWDHQNLFSCNSRFLIASFLYRNTDAVSAFDLSLLSQPVSADLGGFPLRGPSPLTVSFDDFTTSAVTLREWDFDGDGVFDAVNPSLPVQRRYTETGFYSVTLRASGPGGTDTVTRRNYVEVVEAPPTALFSFTPDYGFAPFTVTFEDRSTGTITLREWDFDGDGTIDATNPPEPITFTYEDPTSQTAQLHVWGPQGDDTQEHGIPILGSVSRIPVPVSETMYGEYYLPILSLSGHRLTSVNKVTRYQGGRRLAEITTWEYSDSLGSWVPIDRGELPEAKDPDFNGSVYAALGGHTAAILYNSGKPELLLAEFGTTSGWTQVAHWDGISGWDMQMTSETVAVAGYGGVAFFERDIDGHWSRSPDVPVGGEYPSTTVDISGSTVVAGTYQRPPYGEELVYVIEKDGYGTWNQTQVLEPPDRNGEVFGFGELLGISDHTIAIGASERTPPAVYLYEKGPENQWVLGQTLELEEGLGNIGVRDDNWLDIDDDLLIVGPCLRAGPNTVYTFRKKGDGRWSRSGDLASDRDNERFARDEGGFRCGSETAVVRERQGNNFLDYRLHFFDFSHIARRSPIERWSDEFGELQGWDAGQNPRFLSDATGDGLQDVVGFSYDGVRVAPASGSGFAASSVWAAGFDETAGWTPERHIRCVADVSGDGKADLVAIGERGVAVGLSTGDFFFTPTLWSRDFGARQGWDPVRHPRVLADLNGDGRADLVGFGERAVIAALSTGQGFSEAAVWCDGFGARQGWSAESHLRLVDDVNGDTRADLVGFADRGVVVALSDGSSFGAPTMWVENYGRRQGWTTERHPRFLADANGDGVRDIIGFGDRAILVSLSTGSSFAPAQAWSREFAAPGAPSAETPLRLVADMNGDGRNDCIVFIEEEVRVALSEGTSFAPSQTWVKGFGLGDYWRNATRPRLIGDLDGDTLLDIVGFYTNGVYVY